MHARRQHGLSLIEALIAFLVLALGMLAIARMQGQMRLGTEVARQRSEAVRLAQEEIESQRAFTLVAAAPGVRSFDAIANRRRTVVSSPTTYVVTQTIATASIGRAKALQVGVAWTDRAGQAQQVALDSWIAGETPTLSGALGLQRANTTRGARGRSTQVPRFAVNLGDGRSAFKPVDSGAVALLLDNVNGWVVGRCSAVAPTVATMALTAASLGTCDTQVGYLLSGVVRFATASPPDPAHAGDVPLPFAVTMALTVGPTAIAPLCSTEPIASANGDRYTAYHCVIYPAADGRWSGALAIVPTGWTLGSGSGDHRVCRYGDVPAIYADVAGSLANQNLLVVNGAESCPPAAPTP